MSQRILRTVPAALLMTTALAWNLPADLTPAMPASAASGAASAGKPAGMPAPRSTRP